MPPQAPRRAADIAGIGVRPAGKRRRAGDQNVGAGLDRGGRRIGVDAAIDLQVDLAAARVDQLAQRLDLVELRADEALPAEAGIDAHHQDRGRHRRSGNRPLRPAWPGSATTPAFLPSDLDELEGAVQVRRRPRDGRVMISAPALAKAAMNGSTGEIIRWTSNGPWPYGAAAPSPRPGRW